LREINIAQYSTVIAQHQECTRNNKLRAILPRKLGGFTRNIPVTSHDLGGIR
jgi:hypothetical protein